MTAETATVLRMADEQKRPPASWEGRSRAEVLAGMNATSAPKRKAGVDYSRAVVFLLVMGGAVWAGFTGHFAVYVVTVLLVGVVLLLAALILRGFANEIAKIFRR